MGGHRTKINGMTAAIDSETTNAKNRMEPIRKCMPETMFVTRLVSGCLVMVSHPSSVTLIFDNASPAPNERTSLSMAPDARLAVTSPL